MIKRFDLRPARAARLESRLFRVLAGAWLAFGVIAAVIA